LQKIAVQSLDLNLHTFRSPEFAGVVKKAVEFMSKTPVHPLPPDFRFSGVGVYALYYMGGFEHYTHLKQKTRPSCSVPIYVGKAVPSGWRTARIAHDDESEALMGRLEEHAQSIRQTANLKVEDFSCRFMVLQGLESDLITAVEATLIRLYKPAWNGVIDGFGNHDPGSGRYGQARSEWDILHPGRYWAKNLKGQSVTVEAVIVKLSIHKQRLLLP